MHLVTEDNAKAFDGRDRGTDLLSAPPCLITASCKTSMPIRGLENGPPTLLVDNKEFGAEDTYERKVIVMVMGDDGLRWVLDA